MIAKDLIDSEDPKHTLFCRENAFVVIYALFWVIFPSFDGNSNIFATSIEEKKFMNRKAIRTGKLSIEQKTYRKNRKAIDRSEWLSTE